MAENDFLPKLEEVIEAKRAWFESTALPKMKSGMLVYLASISSIYSLFVQKGHITEDPYKNETKTNDLTIPDSSPIAENKKKEQLGLRISALIKEMDFLCNFYDFNMGGFSQEKIKVILGIIRFIDWPRLTTDSQSNATKALASILTDARRSIVNEPMSAKLMTDSIKALESGMPTILTALKEISDFNRELYKLDVRKYVTSKTQGMDAAAIKKAMAKDMSTTAFYPDLIDEIIKEDKSQDLQDKLIKKLLPPDGKSKAPKAPVNFRPILIDGLNAIGSSGSNISEILAKVKENHDLLQSAAHGFFGKIKKMFNIGSKDDGSFVYELEYADPVKGSIVKDKITFRPFMIESEKRAAILSAMAPKGSAAKKLETMDEKQLTDILLLNIKNVQKLHGTLTGLDEYFKKEVDKADRSKVKGIKPELSALKNAQAKAQQKLQDYNAQKEEAEQFKRLGIDAE
ncbi:MAG: hypothetical protein Ta2G_07080 [Termitinemataceae bacterium]|nr:MAG: hypothetical protein Ta2G_07080 [Termitinemataceae bacterium]